MQAVKGGEIPFCDRLQNRLEYLDVVGMGEEVAVQHPCCCAGRRRLSIVRARSLDLRHCW